MENPAQENISLGPPPKETVIADFHSLLDSVKLLTNETNRKLLLMQTIQGHANMADGKFRTAEEKEDCTRYPNTTLEDIAQALADDERLGMTPTEVKEKRLKNILEIEGFIKKALKGEKIKRIQNDEREPLLGIKLFDEILLKNPMNVAKGFYLGSIMDNYTTWRKQLEKEPYNLVMGGGECIAVDMSKLNQGTVDEMLKSDENVNLKLSLAMKVIDGFHLGTLAKEEWAEHISMLYDKGIIINQEVVSATDRIRSAYVRHKAGKGVSDNAAVVMAGILYGKKSRQDGIETALGVYLADAVDTLDKYLPMIYKDGVDEAIGREIESSGRISLTEKEKLNFIFFSAIHPKKKMPDCSQRYFLQIDEKADDTAIENHITYLQGDKPKKMIFGHKATDVGVKSEEFYGTIEKQLKKYSYLL